MKLNEKSNLICNLKSMFTHETDRDSDRNTIGNVVVIRIINLNRTLRFYINKCVYFDE